MIGKDELDIRKEINDHRHLPFSLYIIKCFVKVMKNAVGLDSKTRNYITLSNLNTYAQALTHKKRNLMQLI